jgi:hypothetical protein
MNDIDDRQDTLPNGADGSKPIGGKPTPPERRAEQARKKAEAVARQQAALRLRLAGATFEDIARQLGYASKCGALKAYRAALNVPTQESRVEARQLCRLRYERLLLTWWPKAIAGDERASDRVCNLLADLRELDALDLPRRHRLEHAGKNGGPIAIEARSAPDLSRLTDEQLQQYRELIDFLLDGAGPGPGPDSAGPASRRQPATTT